MPVSEHSTRPSSDAFLAALVNSSGDAILTVDLDGVVTTWNRGAERMFGYTPEEMLGQPVTLLYPPDRPDEKPGILGRIRRGELIDHYETVRRRKDGTHIDISLTVSPIVDEKGTVIGASKIARDVTFARREQERLRVTLSSIGDAVISTDATGAIMYMNPVAEELTGWKESEVIGQELSRIAPLVDEVSHEPVDSPVLQALREGTVITHSNHALLVSKDGRERPVDDRAAPIRDTRGNVIGAVLVMRDVSERRAADLAAKRLAAMIEGSDDAIVAKNLQGIVTDWNPGAERVFGYTAAEMIGQPILKLLPLDRRDEEQHILSRLQRGERVDHFQTIRVRKDGQLIHVSLTISPIRDRAGRIIGASKIARDITALRKAQAMLESHATELEAKVRERTARLEEAVAELEAFSYSLSHDMRAPLRAIQSFTEIVLQDFGDKIPEGTEYLRKVIAAANRMDRLINDVLNFARVSRGEVALTPVNVERLVRDIILERSELQPPHAEIRVASPLLPVMGHDASLTQCLTNLLDNAVKFVPAGVTPKVNVYTKAVGDRVRICVQDNGIGIDPEGQQRLFAIFQRLATAQIYKGTGVGLAIVRKAAERMHGSVVVESSLGLGSTFCLDLPKAPA